MSNKNLETQNILKTIKGSKSKIIYKLKVNKTKYNLNNKNFYINDNMEMEIKVSPQNTLYIDFDCQNPSDMAFFYTIMAKLLEKKAETETPLSKYCIF